MAMGEKRRALLATPPHRRAFFPRKSTLPERIPLGKGPPSASPGAPLNAEKRGKAGKAAGEIISPAPPCFCLPASPRGRTKGNGKIYAVRFSESGEARATQRVRRAASGGKVRSEESGAACKSRVRTVRSGLTGMCGTRAGNKVGGCVFSRASSRRSFFIWRSFRQHRCDREAGTSVGHRRWVRKDTPAPTRQSGQRPPGLPAFAPFSGSSRVLEARLPVSGQRPPRGEAARRTRGERGELFPPPGSGAEPRCLSCLSCLSCLFCVYQSTRARRG